MEESLCVGRWLNGSFTMRRQLKFLDSLGKKRKMHMELGRKGGTHVRLGPGPLAGDTEEERNITHRLRDPPWENNHPSLV